MTIGKLAPIAPPPAAPTRPPEQLISITPAVGESYVSHPGHGLTAQTILSVFSAAEAGRPAQQCDLFDDLLDRDGHLRSVCESRIESVAGKSWIIAPGGEDDVDGAAAKALENALRNVENFGTTLEHQLTASLYGWAATEIGWEVVDGLVVPVWFVNVPHRRIRFDVDTDEPRLLTRESQTDGIPLQSGRWLFVRRQGRKTSRSGLLRTATWWSWLKQLALRDWQIFSSRFGVPFVLGKYATNADTKEIEALKEAIAAFGRAGGAVLPEHTDIDVKDPASASGAEGIHAALADRCDRELSKLILGGTLTSGEGTSTGSYALGRVHENNQFGKTVSDADRLGHTIATQLGIHFCRWNPPFARAKPPRLKVRVVRESDPMSRMQIASIFANELGGALDEDQVRDEFDLKRPSGTALTGSKAGQAVAAGGPDPGES